MPDIGDADLYNFSAIDRKAGDEDELTLTSVGIDIGSSTSHLIFSRLILERRGSRYETVKRIVIRESDILLTPFSQDDKSLIDAERLGEFIDAEYAAAGVERTEVDTGALVLTGLAVRRKNAREIGELFAFEAGRFVTVTAGDGLEATMAAYGSGAVAASTDSGSCLNIDVGGGTTKIAFCSEGRVDEVTAIDVGARLVTFGDDGLVLRVEPAAEHFGRVAGADLEVGKLMSAEDIHLLVGSMADAVVETIIKGPNVSDDTASLLRCPPLSEFLSFQTAIFSGGVSEFLYGREASSFGDLGRPLAVAIKSRVEDMNAPILPPVGGIRATAMGASQHTVQVSGSTIFVSPMDVLPVRNVPVMAPKLDLSQEIIDSDSVAAEIRSDVERLDILLANKPAALAMRWEGSATYQRLESFCKGLIEGLGPVLENGHPLVVVGDGDIGGLIGMHLRQGFSLANAIISIDGVDLNEFDFIDVGELISTSGAVPVVIKSLVFPADAVA